MIHFVGAGPGAPDLITLRGAKLLREADQILYAGSLVNPALLEYAAPGCLVFNTAAMTLEQVLARMEEGERRGWSTVRLHTGDPSLYGAIREQMAALERLGLPCDCTPGVSSFSAAAAALHAEYTLPGVSQTLILSRMAGRTPVPEREDLAALASHGASLVLFLSAGLLPQVQRALLQGAYEEDTPAALVFRASWPEEKVLPCTVGTLARTGEDADIRATALVLVGEFLRGEGQRSCLYDPAFSTGFRKGTRP